MTDTERLDVLEAIARERGSGDRYAVVGLMLDERCGSMREAIDKLAGVSNEHAHSETVSSPYRWIATLLSKIRTAPALRRGPRR